MGTPPYHKASPDALNKFAELVDTFVRSPEKVFEASKDHCCFCGRKLTDQLSRCRGIGPECLERITLCFRIFTNYGLKPPPAEIADLVADLVS